MVGVGQRLRLQSSTIDYTGLLIYFDYVFMLIGSENFL